MRVLVTGASGFLGGHVAAQLRQAGHDVAALVRRPGSEPEGTRPVQGDLTDPVALSAAVAGERPECVVHLAAEIASQRDPKRIQAVNVDGMRRLLEACRAIGDGMGPRIVFSSTVVTGDAHGALLDEETALPVETEYGRSKQAGEAMLRESGLPWVVIRPSHVYGPGGWYEEEFVKRLKLPGRFAVIGKGDNLWDVVRVEDVASAIVESVDSAPAGSTYHVADDEPITFYDFIALTALALGVGRPRRVPAGLARIVAGRDPILGVTRSARSSNAKIKRELSWSPRWPNARVGVPDAVAKLGAAA